MRSAIISSSWRALFFGFGTAKSYHNLRNRSETRAISNRSECGFRATTRSELLKRPFCRWSLAAGILYSSGKKTGLVAHRESHMKKILLAGIAAAAFCGAPAIAADMPVKGPVYKAAPAPMFNWSGFYVGIEGGGGWGDTEHHNVEAGGSSGIHRISGGLFGGTYGYNWQSGSWVFGLEGDISWSGIKRDFTGDGGAFCPAALQCQTDLRWLGTDRARVGYAWDRLLVYGTAGVAYGNVEGHILAPAFPSGNNTRAGLIYGGGVEWAIAPYWSLKAEYLRADLGDKVTYVGNESISLKNVDIVRVGLNYKFGDPWGKGPVSAKY
jgi:outer membrane immunogenic protein